jgi:enediyne biosynthesis protein E4
MKICRLLCIEIITNLKGDSLNTFATGAEVTIFYNNQKQMLQQIPYRGFESSVDNSLVFGVAKNNVIDSMIIVWPNKMQSNYYNIKSNTNFFVSISDAKINTRSAATMPTWFTNESNILQGSAAHNENVFTDFDAEKLMPQMLSLEGPKMAKADLNNDGLEDIVIGGAKGDGLKLLLQNSNGTFNVTQPADVANAKNFFEDVGISIADIDNDNDQDIIVANGGNESNNDITFDAYTPRVLINDGKANFTRKLVINTTVKNNTSCVVANDFNNDGWVDLFIGGRSVAGSFGVTPQSYLLLNDGTGRFNNLKNDAFQKLGMVTAAVCANMDTDTSIELVTAGQFMPVQIWKWKNNNLALVKTIENTNGWWNTIAIGDLNNDGINDIVGGNLGTNSKLKANEKEPITLYVNDFDKNGQSESVLTYFKTDGKAYPIHLKGEFVSQMPSLKKKFLFYKDYAGKGIESIFGEQILSKTQKLTATEMQTCIFYNKGNLEFEKKALPLQAQLSPIYAIVISDFNKDGINDLYMAGNFSGVKPEIGRYDANYGDLFLNSKASSFQYIPSAVSGLSVRGEARDGIIVQNAKKEKLLWIAINNEQPYIFNLKK